MNTPALLYGPTGYTGGLILNRCLERGLRPVLAGRSDAIRALASTHGLEARVVSLDDAAALRRALEGIRVMLHCAGPFGRTSRAMADACIATGAHYLDITGEIGVFEALAARNEEARGAGVMLLPGVGFDVVPSDCLAAHLKRRMPEAISLLLAFQSSGGVSRGTATTMVENIAKGGAVRKGGKIVPVPAAWKTRMVDLGRGPISVTTIPWGDVATAWYSTGIPDIEVYTRVGAWTRRLLRASRYLAPLLSSRPVQQFLLGRIKRGAPGPDAVARAKGICRLYGEVRSAAGQVCRSRLTGPEGYSLTVLSAVMALEQTLAGNATPGFQTPSMAFGPDFVLGIDGVQREDLD